MWRVWERHVWLWEYSGRKIRIVFPANIRSRWWRVSTDLNASSFDLRAAKVNNRLIIWFIFCEMIVIANIRASYKQRGWEALKTRGNKKKNNKSAYRQLLNHNLANDKTLCDHWTTIANEEDTESVWNGNPVKSPNELKSCLFKQTEIIKTPIATCVIEKWDFFHFVRARFIKMCIFQAMLRKTHK